MFLLERYHAPNHVTFARFQSIFQIRYHKNPQADGLGVLIIIRYLMKKYIRMYDMIFYVPDSHLLPGIVLCQIFYKA